MLANPVEVPCIIGGKEVTSGDLVEMRAPHDHSQVLGRYHRAGPREAEMAIYAANQAKLGWSEKLTRTRRLGRQKIFPERRV